MISLLLDTSNFKLVVAVVDEDKNEVLSYYNEKLNSDLSVKVFEVIKQCIDNANIIPNDIDKIYSITGPGSFTGVRIGVTICKTFAWTLNKKVIPISSLELLASTNTNYELNVAMIDARRDCVYAGVYDNELNTVIEDRYISIEQLFFLCFYSILWTIYFNYLYKINLFYFYFNSNLLYNFKIYFQFL